MAYSTSNAPAMVAQGINGGRKLWFYASTDAATVVRTDGYFSNGYELGMRSGDLVHVVDTDASPIAAQIMIVSSADATNGVDLSDGTAVTATNTD